MALINNLRRFFATPIDPTHRRYEALRAYYYEGKSAKEVAGRFGHTVNTIYSLAQDFCGLIKTKDPAASFFAPQHLGRHKKDPSGKTEQVILELRKKYLSVPDIKAILDSRKFEVSEKYVYNVVREAGFARLPRRSISARRETFGSVQITAEKSQLLDYSPEIFQTQSSIGILCMLPYIQEYGLDELINKSKYPGTTVIPKLNAILSFVALKLSNFRRYTADDMWCMDRGLGLFAGLNVLPKAAWFTSYSHRVTRKMNLHFLKSLAKRWNEKGLLGDTANLDFTTIPYWGDDSHLENNWSGTRHKALAGILAALCHDPDSGIITYGDTNVRHDNQANVVVEFLDFYTQSGGDDLKYLVFDSKLTTYENLRKLDKRDIKFLTIRKRGKNIIKNLEALPSSERKTIRVPTGNGKTRSLLVVDQVLFLAKYEKEIRQVAIIGGHGKIKPALIITNDFELALEKIVRKYARRWLVEKTISEQIEFFHLNKVSSSMVIKVDFDLTMTILAHNLYRVFAQNLPGYSHNTASTLFQRFIYNSGDIKITNSQIIVNMKKKRHLPAILTALERFQNKKILWTNRSLLIRGASRS